MLTEVKNSSDPMNRLSIVKLQLFILLCSINCNSFCNLIGAEYQDNSHLMIIIFKRFYTQNTFNLSFNTKFIIEIFNSIQIKSIIIRFIFDYIIIIIIISLIADKNPIKFSYNHSKICKYIMYVFFVITKNHISNVDAKLLLQIYDINDQEIRKSYSHLE